MELRERGKQESLNQPEESLREKLKQVHAKWQHKDFKPKDEQHDQFGMAVSLILWTSSLFEMLVFLIPSVFPESRWLVSLLTSIMFCETLINWHRSYFDTENYVKADAKEKYFPQTDGTPQDWTNCIKCQVDVPPRAYHCNHCGKCMLKRVHHCYMTGSCIGFYNHKFFIVFCLWSTISFSFCIFTQLAYLSDDLPILSIEIFTYLPPVAIVKLLIGYISFGQTLVILHMFFSIIFWGISGAFFLWHLFLVYEGVTMFEGWKKIYAFSGTFMENLKTVFGSLWHIPVLVFIPYRFAHTSDGIQWKVRCKRVKGQ